MARNWTPEERTNQSRLIRGQKPWQQSTGPVTETGKSAVAGNTEKHGFRGRHMAEIRKLLRIQRNFVKLLMAQNNAKTMENMGKEKENKEQH